jgi:hypothetical protein
MDKITIILVAVLAVSEAMALIPQLKGNGILDNIIKYSKIVIDNLKK